MSRLLLGRILGAEGICASRQAFLRLLPPSVPPPGEADADRARMAVGRALGLRPAEEEGFAGRAVGALVAAGRAGSHATRETGDDLPEADALLRAELRRPPMMDHFTRGLRDRSEMALLYALSTLVADPADERAAHYLRMLSARLGLECTLADRLNAWPGNRVSTVPVSRPAS